MMSNMSGLPGFNTPHATTTHDNIQETLVIMSPNNISLSPIVENMVRNSHTVPLLYHYNIIELCVLTLIMIHGLQTLTHRVWVFTVIAVLVVLVVLVLVVLALVVLVVLVALA
jgi:lysylphosphatidylglycerol synthetase-like protein (DUF2156 family)